MSTHSFHRSPRAFAAQRASRRRCQTSSASAAPTSCARASPTVPSPIAPSTPPPAPSWTRPRSRRGREPRGNESSRAIPKPRRCRSASGSSARGRTSRRRASMRRGSFSGESGSGSSERAGRRDRGGGRETSARAQRRRTSCWSFERRCEWRTRRDWRRRIRDDIRS